MIDKKKTRKELETNFKKQVFIDAAIKVFAAQGFQKTSIEMIASETGYAAGTIYNYFKSKEELYGAALNYIGNTFLESLKAAIGGIKDPFEKLRQFVIFKFNFGIKNIDFIRVIFSEETTFEWHLKKESRISSRTHIYNKVMEIELSIIKDCQKAGKLQKGEPALLTTLLDSFFDGYFLYRLKNNQKELITKEIGKIFEYFIKGFGTER